MGGSWLEGGGNGHEVDVVELLDADVAKGLGEIVQTGALLSLGTTSDGGALGLTVTVDGVYRREYVRSHDELLAWLAEAVPGVTEASGGTRPSAGGRERTRRSRKR
jgi:hypothetical protein